jgi:ribosome-binding factor A
MARVNALLQEIIGDELERIDDERLELVTVTAVDCESDLRRAVVQFDSLRGAEDDEAVLAAFGNLRPRLQKAVARQARLKRTPELRFEPDVVIRSAERVDEVLRGIEPPNDPT